MKDHFDKTYKDLETKYSLSLEYLKEKEERILILSKEIKSCP